MVRYVKNNFDVKGEQPTVGAGFLSKEIELKAGQHVRFQVRKLHRFCKNCRFGILLDKRSIMHSRQCIIEVYLPRLILTLVDSHVALLVYDVTAQESFGVLKQWVKELKDFGPDKMIFAIAGNKIDLSSQIEVEFMTALDYAKSINALFNQTSAKEDRGIAELFAKIGDEALKTQNYDEPYQATSRISVSRPSETRDPPKSSECSC